jgi:hypothetical protein
LGSHALSLATFWNYTAHPFAFREGLNLGRPASNNPTDLPDGLFGELPVKSPLQKYIASRFGRHSFIDSLSRPIRGALAIVTNVGRDAMDADSAETNGV